MRKIIKFLTTKRGFLIAAAIIYLVSPIDIVPEFIFPFGMVDDTIILIFLIRELVALKKEYKFKKQSSIKNNDAEEILEGEIIE